MGRGGLWRATVAGLAATTVVASGWSALAVATARPSAALAPTAQWSPFPADTTSTGALIPDPNGRVGLALSDNSPTPDQQWTRTQVVSLSTGRPLGRTVSIPPFREQPFFAPHWFDARHHVLFYAAPQPAATPAAPTSWHLVGVSDRGATAKVVFDVATRFGSEGVVSIAADADGRNLLLAATFDRAGTGASFASGTGVDLDRVSVDGLLTGKFVSPWASTYSVPKTLCPSLIASSRAPELLAFGSSAFLGCRQANAFGSSLVTVNRTLSGVLRLDGVGVTRASTVTARLFAVPGNYEASGESIADAADRRLVLVDSSNGIGARVFDATHNRYVGRTPLGFQIPSGYAIDESSGRLYVGSDDATVGLATPDLRALVPTQGLRVPEPWAALFQQNARLLFGFVSSGRRLLVPAYIAGAQHPYQILVAHDTTPAYLPPTTVNPDAGALDVREQPGVTDSQRSASAQAYGADYQLIGGAADLQQNAGSGDEGASQRPGSNFLRQSEVSQATLTSDESTAEAVTGREDEITNGYRQGVPNAGNQFAPSASCSDFGTSASPKPLTSYTAFVDCNYSKSRTHTGASFVADSGVFVTTGSNAPVASPVQVSSSSVDITETRAPGLGAVTTTVMSTADGIQLPGLVHIGSVTTMLKLSTHGRHGTAVAVRTVTVHDVTVASTVVCTNDCSSSQVQDAIETAAPGRVRIDFPAAETDASRGGTYAEVVQDAWFHAERVLDADKSDTDVAVPAMTITVNIDGQTKSRLVVDLAAAAASNSYRIFTLSAGGPAVAASGSGQAPPKAAAPLGALTGTPSTAAAPAASPEVAAGGVLPTLARAARIVFGSLGRMLELLPVFLLLGVPVYLSARRRLLLELPLLSRDEETQ